jgi:L-aminopeptidase/D-esterase-like protein
MGAAASRVAVSDTVISNVAASSHIVIQTGAQTVLPQGFLVGHAQDTTAGTGCTAVICEQGAIGGVAVRGAAPATRETDLLDPRNTVEKINAVILSGGSAFGLESAGGVTRWLVERDAGFAAGAFVVPIVCGACIFDLTVGDGRVRPDAALGYAACKNASTSVATGNVGVGIGASVGKILGSQFSMKGGFGAASITLDGLIVTALVVVNAWGNVYDPTSKAALAGIRDPQTSGAILDPYQALLMAFAAQEGAVDPSKVLRDVPFSPTNTTIGCILSNAVLTKAQASRVADMTHDGYARVIEPVHTDFDGDAVFVLSTATVSASSSLVGVLAASVMEQAIGNAVRSATTAYGLPSAKDLTKTNV